MNEEILLDIKVQNSDALTNIGKLASANKELKNGLDDIKKAYKAGEISESDYAKQSAVINAQIKENTSGIRENSKELKTNAASVASAGDSINGMRARLSDLTSVYNGLSASAREGDAGKAIQAEMLSLNTSVNTANKSIGNFKDNIGHYPDAMAGMGLANTKAGKTLDSLGITANSSFKGIASTVSSGISSIGSSFKVLLTNPIFAIIAALVATFFLLKDAISSSSKATNTLKEATAIFTPIINILKNILVGTVQVFLDGFLAISKFASALISLTGANDRYSKSVADAAKVEKERQEIAKKNRELIVEEAEGNLKVAKLRDQVTEKDKYTRAQRAGFLQEAIATEKKMADEKQKIAVREYNNLVKELRSKDELNSEEKTKLAEAKAKLLNVETEYYTSIRRMKTQVATFNKAEDDAIKAAAEKANEDAKKAQEKRLAQIEKAQNEEIKRAENLLALKKINQKDLDDTLLTDPKYFQQRLNLLTKNAEDEKVINKLKLRYHKEGNDEYLIADSNINKELANNKIELQKQLANQTIKELDYELQLKKVQNDTLKIGEKLTNEEIHNNKISEIEKANKDELNKLKIQKKAGIITEDEYLNQVQLKNAEKNFKIAQDNADFEASEKERKLQAQSDNYANELSLLNENSQKAIEIKKAQLDAQMALEIETANKSGASTTLIEQKYAKLKKDIDKKVNDDKLNQAKAITDGVVNLFGKTTKAGKAAASASVAIDTYKGAQSAIAGMAGAGPVGWTLGAVEAGVIIAGGIKSIADIWAVNENSTSSVNSNSASTATTSNANSGSIYTNLPSISSMYNSTANQNETAQIISQSQPAPVVSVSEITNMQNVVKVKENSKL